MSAASLRSFEYLEGLSGSELNKLYEKPSTALAIFRRMLPQLAKSLVLSMLYSPDPLPRSDLEAWIRPSHKSDLGSALSLLTRLHIVQNVRAEGTRPAGLGLTKDFAESLRNALTGDGGGNKKQPGGHKSFGVPVDTPAGELVSVEKLDNYARDKWEGMLGYMVATTADIGSMFRGVDDVVSMILQMGDYVEKRPAGKVAITKGGFELLMQKANAQVWALLITYLDNDETTQINATDALAFFFMLGSLELGQAYSVENLGRSEKTILVDLRALGLVYQSSKNSSCFYPTRLATTLTSDSPALREGTANSTTLPGTGDGENTDGFIVIETNYRLYAYTTSPLQIAILNLFAKLEIRYPNMVSGRLTRSSVHKAIDMGITSDQIIDFLATHAHSQMRRSGAGMKGGQVLPPTVMDQIRLWQLENERMVQTPGFLFKEFNTEEEYMRLAQYADEIGVLKWRSDRKRLFFVTRYEQIAAYFKNNMQKKTADVGSSGASGRVKQTDKQNQKG